MKSQNLKIKDLVTIGVFAAIYFAVLISVGMIGLVPILFLLYPTILGIVSGTIVMLLMAKIQKPWAIFIFGLLCPLLMFSMGHTIYLLIHAVIIMFLSEMVRRIGKYRSFFHNALSFAIFNMWICGSLMQMLWAREEYIEMSMMMGKEYADALVRLITYPHMALVYLGAFVGGVLGAFLGKVLLKKHFVKAGIV